MPSKCFCVQDDEDSDQGLIMRESSSPNPEPTAIAENSIFFRDGIRKIDFLLVYEETSRRYASNGPTVLDTSGDRRAKLETWRQQFMTNLRRAGLDMEEVRSTFFIGRRSWRKTEIGTRNSNYSWWYVSVDLHVNLGSLLSNLGQK